MTYKEYREKKQAEFNALPIFFAFNNEQFKREMEKRGLTENDTDKVYRWSNGTYYLRKDADKIREFVLTNEKDNELNELMKIPDFAISAFEFEMENHEYAINLQGDFDVCNIFCDREPEYDDMKDYANYLMEDGHSDWIPFYEQAREIYYRKAEQYGWG